MVARRDWYCSPMTIQDLKVRLAISGVTDVVRGFATVRQSGRDLRAEFGNLGGALLAAGSNALQAAQNIARLGAAVATLAGATLAVSAFKNALQFDSAVRGLALLTRNASDLRNQIARLRDIAAGPGVDFLGAITASARLQGAGVSANTAERAIRAIGNAVASSGGSVDDFNESLRQLSQTASGGKLQGEEINVLADRIIGFKNLIKQAFGTTDSKAINALGLTPDQLLGGIIGAAEQLPQLGSSVQNTLDNIRQSAQDAIRPLGQGILAFVLSLAGPSATILQQAAGAFRAIGESIAAVGRSGAGADALNRFVEGLRQVTNTNGIQDLLENIIARSLVFISNLPQIGKTIFDFMSASGNNLLAVIDRVSLGVSIVVNQLRLALSAASSIVEAIKNPLQSTAIFEQFKMQQALEAVRIGQNVAGLRSFQDLPNVSIDTLLKQAGLDDSPLLQSYLDKIRGSRGPLPDIPEGLQFGGPRVNNDRQQTTLLEKIETNTREAVNIQRAIRGGGVLGQIGVTQQELGQDDGLTAALDRRIKRKGTQQIALAAGGGFRPR